MSYNFRKGFTLIEVLVATAVFLVIAFGVFNAYTALLRLANQAQSHILAVELADEQFEIIRNMPYVNVGLTNGIPLGVLPATTTLVRGGFTFQVSLVIRNINLSTTTLQASSKLVEVDITCPSCTNFNPVNLTGQVAPANLATAANGGALVIEVFDSNGVPIQGVTVFVQSLATSTVTNTDITDNDGTLPIIGVPPGSNMYRITVSKTGYSSARSYPIGAGGNPNPTIPDATVVQGNITTVSFSIDRLSTLRFNSVDTYCTPVANVHFDLTGAKDIGVGVKKYSQHLLTDGSGLLSLTPMEWDTYTIAPTDSSFDVSGMTPFNPVSLAAATDQTVQIVVVPKSSSSLHVAVEDSVTKLPLSDAQVTLTGGTYNTTLLTGQGYVAQSDWSGGPGQDFFSTTNRYYSGDSNIDTSTSSGNIVMNQFGGLYSTIATGTLESSTFNTGTTSNYYSLNWKPSGQAPEAGSMPVKFQFATNPTSTSTVWNFLGPNGTASTYFTVPGMQISSANNGNQFARYKVFLNTDTATVTPSVNDVSFTYTSGCTPPGQVIFEELTPGSYVLTVSKSGYTTSVSNITISSGWQSQLIDLAP